MLLQELLTANVTISPPVDFNTDLLFTMSHYQGNNRVRPQDTSIVSLVRPPKIPFVWPGTCRTYVFVEKRVTSRFQILGIILVMMYWFLHPYSLIFLIPQHISCSLIKTLPLSHSPLLLHIPLLSSALPPSHLTASVCRCPSFFPLPSQPALSPKSHEALSRLCFGLSTHPPPSSPPSASPHSLSPSIPLPSEASQG